MKRDRGETLHMASVVFLALALVAGGVIEGVLR